MTGLSGWQPKEELAAFVSALGALKKGVAAIDGMCASGKTTLAAHLGGELGMTVLHMDDFFLQPLQRTPERLAQPGGNVDRERFRDEVLAPLLAGAEEIAYRRFDCAAQTLLAPRIIRPTPVVLVEGAYSMHPALRDAYALSAFVGIAPQLQRARILARNGEEGLRRFEARWIPLENAYIAACGVERACGFRLSAE